MTKSNINLTENIRSWVVNSVDHNAKIITTGQLKGSTSSTLYRISLQLDQCVEHVVLRLFDNDDWLSDEPDLALHEAGSLCLAAKADLETPAIIAFDEKGEHCGMPTVLMTMLEGSLTYNLMIGRNG
ncbi:hypothetical protein [Lentibacillus sp. Marseille-P4043]|uniref:hypothetical protein n=1 Tax=Lentibacillus sp. Marseille-P4043 TaxID=2040293 RepID=UPI000D0B98DA|nr:hypothetical protein [Lentibacillus sp. Marseille-P4043]